jgi:hypothetical protein
MQGNGATGADRPRRVIASYDTYGDAERAVDLLADAGFPVERVAIVGRGLHVVEQVTGRMTWGRAAIEGALPGALVGFLVGWLFGLFNWYDPVIASAWLALHGIWFGALVGALAQVIAYALQRGRRDFGSIRGMSADRYELLVDDEVADEARRLLATTTQAPQSMIPG